MRITTLCVIIFSMFALAGTPAFAGGLPDEMSGSSSGVVERSGASGVIDSMELYAGQEAVLKLKADTEVGYSWRAVETWDKNVLEFVGKESMMPATENELGAEVWTFKALRPGKTELTFRYVDPAGDSSPRSMDAVFDVVVKEGAAEKTGPFIGKLAPYYAAGTVISMELSGAASRVNPRLTVKTDDGGFFEFVVKPLCLAYKGDGIRVPMREISSGDRVTVNYRINKKGVNEAVAIKVE